MSGAILYEGPSRITGEPIVAIATGIGGTSSNPKTGSMVQTWILCQDTRPAEARRTGADEAICGKCIHRTFGGTSTCYVNVGFGPTRIWKTYKGGGYAPIDDELRGHIVASEHVRLGAYGDPVAVPLEVWASIMPREKRRATGYTHQWRLPVASPYRNFLMASVEDEEQKAAANKRGWRTFRTMSLDESPAGDELHCPSDKRNPGKHVPCEDCGACNGARGMTNNVSIYVHGVNARNFGNERKPELVQLPGRSKPADVKHIVLEPDLHAKFKALCKDLGTTMRGKMRSMIKSELRARR